MLLDAHVLHSPQVFTVCVSDGVTKHVTQGVQRRRRSGTCIRVALRVRVSIFLGEGCGAWLPPCACEALDG